MFFAATYVELRGAFVGSRRPLPEPTPRTVLSPFTKEPQVQLLWTPDPTDNERFAPLPGQGIGHRIASLPCLDVDEDDFDLAAVLAQLTGQDDTHWEKRIGYPPALVDPKSERYEWNVWELPEDAMDALVQVGASADEAAFVSNDAMPAWLPELAKLAAEARATGRRLYLWC